MNESVSVHPVSERLQSFPRFGGFGEIGQLFVPQYFAISVRRFLGLTQFFETLAACDISLRHPGQELLITDIDALEIGVRFRPLAAFGGDLA